MILKTIVVPRQTRDNHRKIVPWIGREKAFFFIRGDERAGWRGDLG